MTKFKQLLVPAVVILMGAGAAFATNVAKESDDGMVDGYYYDNTTNQCLKAGDTRCTTTPGVICTWTDPNTLITHQVRQLGESSCGAFLYEPQ